MNCSKFLSETTETESSAEQLFKKNGLPYSSLWDDNGEAVLNFFLNKGPLTKEIRNFFKVLEQETCYLYLTWYKSYDNRPRSFDDSKVRMVLDVDLQVNSLTQEEVTDFLKVREENKELFRIDYMSNGEKSFTKEEDEAYEIANDMHRTYGKKVVGHYGDGINNNN